MTPHEATVSGLMLEMYLDYDPLTGVLTRKLSTNPHSRAGDVLSVINDEGYIVCHINGMKLRGHRVAWCWMTGSWPENDIDHINGDRADNRFCNLRAASRSQNLMNSGFRSNNTSGVVGVGFCVDRHKWYARIKQDKKEVFLGRFESFSDAVAARKEAEAKIYGEFAPTHRKLGRGVY